MKHRTAPASSSAPSVVAQPAKPSSLHKKWRQSAEIIQGRVLGRRREDLDRDVIGAGVVVASLRARDRLILAPGGNGIEDGSAPMRVVVCTRRSQAARRPA